MSNSKRTGRERSPQLSRKTAEKWVRVMIDRGMITWDDELGEWAGIIPVYSEANHRGPQLVSLGADMGAVAEFIRFYPQPRDW